MNLGTWIDPSATYFALRKKVRQHKPETIEDMDRRGEDWKQRAARQKHEFIIRKRAMMIQSEGVSLESAEAEVRKWRETAFEFLKTYARANATFCGWMVVRASQNDPAFPKTTAGGKEWGAIIKRAVKEGVIKKVGAVKDPHRCGNLIPLWGVIYPEISR